MRHHVHQTADVNDHLLAGHILYPQIGNQNRDKGKQTHFNQKRQTDGDAQNHNALEHRNVQSTFQTQTTKFFKIRVIAYVKPQTQRVDGKHQHRAYRTAYAAQARQTPNTVNQHIIDGNAHAQAKQADPHHGLGFVQTAGIRMQTAVNQGKWQSQGNPKHVIRKHMLHVLAQFKIMIQWRNQTPHNEHAQDAQHECQPHTLTAHFAQVGDFLRAIQL